jgi:hypothetical protein
MLEVASSDATRAVFVDSATILTGIAAVVALFFSAYTFKDERARERTRTALSERNANHRVALYAYSARSAVAGLRSRLEAAHDHGTPTEILTSQIESWLIRAEGHLERAITASEAASSDKVEQLAQVAPAFHKVSRYIRNHSHNRTVLIASATAALPDVLMAYHMFSKLMEPQLQVIELGEPIPTSPGPQVRGLGG